MRLDGAIFSIEQRSIGGCIDLATVFVRKQLLPVLQLLLCFAVPSVMLTWWLVGRYEWSTAGCVLLFGLECPLFGAALVAASGRHLFGDQFSFINGIRQPPRRWLLYAVLMVVVRLITLLASWLLLLPAYFVATRYGFLAEVLFLEKCPGRRFERRLSELMHETFLSLVGRLIVLVVFFSVVVVSVFALVDVASGTLLGVPILFGRVSEIEYLFEELTTLLNYDQRVTTVLISVMWLVYPITRLAWMFCYIDVRIRKEGWDVELAFRVETRRLETAV